ncbi:protein FLX-like 4 [Salvia splendens]|uniref:protein FLX-like 4 n=1 Tax=Salvia splendens TaxID=180675 RepID=UPI001C27A1EE|nr:protein FLX-like 4 [Salvia splendens]
MDSRRNIPSAYNERERMMRRDQLPPTHYLSTEPLVPELLDRKLATQAVEIEQLTTDNRKLAASYMALRKELADAKVEAEKIRENMRSTQNEGDIQIRILLDKIAKTDADTGVWDTMKRELQVDNAEARRLMSAKLELSVKLEQATKELDITCENIEKNPDMRLELASLRREYQRLRKTFEYGKCTNVEKVEQLKILERDLIGVAEEVDILRAAVLNAETRASGNHFSSYSSSYMNLDGRYPLPYHGNGSYSNSFGIAHPYIVNGALPEVINPYDSVGIAHPHIVNRGPAEMIYPYHNVGFPVGPVGAAWGGFYTSSPVVGAPPFSSPPVSNIVFEEVSDLSNA